MSPEQQNSAWQDIARATNVAMAGMEKQRACFWPSKFTRATNVAIARIFCLTRYGGLEQVDDDVAETHWQRKVLSP